ncbi:hypothetical protein LJR153_007315 [Paenibacillus sp. LjRoot153]|uniref:hypothetical protein n=1 Tax=Paenibacillus sp. LjRoot153 TaxID=3342270 RepID=UPI003ECC5C02
MKKIISYIFVFTFFFNLTTFTVSAEDSSTTTKEQIQKSNADDKKIGVITERVKESTKNATPEQIQEKLERKGNDLWKTARSGSVLAIGIYAIVFLALLVLGIFWKKSRGLAFGILALGILGYLTINYLPDILDILHIKISG